MPRILIAEDERDLRDFLRDELMDANFTVSTVSNGADAIVEAVEASYDVYLLDMFMPGMDGIQTIRVLRKITPDVPILGLTGYMGQGYMSQAAAWGVTCLAKPVEMQALIQELNEVIAVAKSRAAATRQIMQEPVCPTY
jgi:two-component system nitrogen regulation response regulator NtrX